ncbi:NADH-dependent alcohol dehydrogenase [Odoribacteraceae bacterium]|nr:NADH-dependent alcohol dehydrogenase [Odoribacteraceae bacterium]GKH92380.1 NADH-dependent alcohol dehydrogenase [Odoribacteraceae bacterium]GKH96998.1 NADH-dependent alcohol dehydrogenase [Odoribacteraceae bacterium]GKI03877.1 NADH-dependent alcohol dehydrogenase [Odoribacteraceae bacterium]
MDKFVYQYPVRQYFGKGCAESAIKEEMKCAGQRVLLAYGGGSLKRTGLYDKIRTWLEECDKQVTDFGGIMPNPTYRKVQEGTRLVREHKIDFILAVGGGSVIDCCKIVSAQARMDEDVWDAWYAHYRLPTEFIPMGAVVTASGTGAEQNNGAVITYEEKKLKQPLFGAYHSFAVLDSDLTKTLPMKQVISGAFDTLSHCMETYMGRPQNTNLSDEINEAVMRNVIKNLRALIANPDDDFARGELMWASAMAENGMLKLGKQTDFQCHMIEHAVGAYTDCNHGQGLAVIHPTFYRHLLNEGTQKLARMAETVWGVKGETAEENAAWGIDALEAFIKEIGLPTRWSEMGITDEAVLRAAADTCFLMPGCCKQFSRDEIFEVLKECM